MIVERNYEGAWVVYANIGGYLVTRRYYYYTRAQAVAAFKDEMRALEVANA